MKVELDWGLVMKRRAKFVEIMKRIERNRVRSKAVTEEIIASGTSFGIAMKRAKEMAREEEVR